MVSFTNNHTKINIGYEEENNFSTINKGNANCKRSVKFQQRTFCQQTRRLIFSLLKFDASFTVSISFVDKENKNINFVKWYHSLIAIYNTEYNKINFY